MPDPKIDEYRRQAQHCIEQAQRSASLPDKESWLKMAGQWQELADILTRSGKKNPPEPGQGRADRDDQ
ncbi:MAG: hypothetical protein JWN34_2144 [Bryobacterales bacterium]|nr:hypothetical protein [Bryobacterales bacterium]